MSESFQLHSFFPHVRHPPLCSPEVPLGRHDTTVCVLVSETPRCPLARAQGREGDRVAGMPRSTGPGFGTNTRGRGCLQSVLCGVLRQPRPGGLGTEHSLSEHRKQPSQGGWSTWAGSLARCLGMRLGGGGSWRCRGRTRGGQTQARRRRPGGAAGP